MYQVQQQSPSKLPGSCYKCHKPGHWANSCPESPNKRSPIFRSISVTSDEDFPATHCPCGAGLCQIKVSGSLKNPNRKYYLCPGKYEMHCSYFKWCDQLKREEIKVVQPKSYPICGCGAGICSLKVEENGVNVGRSYFACPIKKGDGACNFRQWLDNSSESASVASQNPVAEENSTLDDFDLNYEAEMQLDAIEMSACDTPLKEAQVNMEGKEEQTSVGAFRTSRKSLFAHPHPAENVSQHLDSEMTTDYSDGDTLKKQKHNFEVKDVQACVAAPVAAPYNRVPPDPSIDSPKSLMAHLPKQVGSAGQIAHLYPEGSFPNFGAVPENVAALNAQAGGGLLPNPSVLLKHSLDDGSIMKGNILLAFEKLAQDIQNNLITLLESMSPHDHKSMRKEADCTYAALKCVQVDYGLFQLRVDEYIKQAASVAHIEQIINEDASLQELVDQFNNEQQRYEELLTAQGVARDAFMGSNSQLDSLCARHSSVELTVELSSCKAEIAVRLDALLQITKIMTECKDSLQAASQKVEEAEKKSETREKERTEANAAFQKARAQLRN